MGAYSIPKRFAAVMFTTIAVRTCHNTQRTGLMSKYALRSSLVAQMAVQELEGIQQVHITIAGPDNDGSIQLK